MSTAAATTSAVIAPFVGSSSNNAAQNVVTDVNTANSVAGYTFGRIAQSSAQSPVAQEVAGGASAGLSKAGSGLTLLSGAINVGTDISKINDPTTSGGDRIKAQGDLVLHSVNTGLELYFGRIPFFGQVLEGGEGLIDGGSQWVFDKLYDVDDYDYPPGKKVPSPTHTSKDPNALVGPAGYGTSGFVGGDETLPYEIDFANEAAAGTLPAQTVKVVETLNKNLDPSTFSFGELGFGRHTVTPPAGSRSYQTVIDDTAVSGLDVKVQATFDSTHSTITWTFTSLDPATGLPPTDASEGFLPPDQTPPDGEGFVSYTATPIAKLATGTKVSAAASITFDTNQALSTGTDTNTLDNGAPTASMTALPASEHGRFTLHWSGRDDKQGSGVATYDVDVTDNGAPYTRLLTNTSKTSTSFTGKNGRSYGFLVWATDNAGNVEATPSFAETVTKIEPASVVRITSRTLKVHGSSLTLPLACAKATCKGEVELTGTKTVKVKKHGKTVTQHVTVIYGEAKYSAASGHKDSVQVKLDKAGAAALKSASHHKLRATATVTNNGGSTVHEPVTLSQA
jgi:hypothetical protein